MTTLCTLFAEQVERRPDHIAVHHRDRDVTYAELAGRAEAIANWLVDAGLQRGDRVVLLLPNSADYVAVYLGILQAGGIVTALNPQTTAEELTYLFTDASPRVVVTGRRGLAALTEAIDGLSERPLLVHTDDVDGDIASNNRSSTPLSAIGDGRLSLRSGRCGAGDLAQIIYTSGTTGRPKGVTLSHRNIVANCRSILEYLELTAADSVLVTLPFFYSYGNSLLFTHLAAGGRLVLASDFVFWNRVLDLMQRERVTGFSGVPSSFAMLLHRSDFRKRSFPGLRYMTCAGGGLAPAVVERLREAVPHARLFLMYGQTEATARLSTLMPEELDAKAGSIGRGIPGVSLDVLDDQGRPVAPGGVGEIVAQGENLMVGYWKDISATREVLRPEGLRTGDLAYADENGYIYMVGRRSDMIKSGAHRINPKEIEETILELDAVAEAAVVGLPDEIWGESPVAFVVPAAAGENLEPQTVIDHCRRRLPRYKHVREVRFVDLLPKTSTGKIKRAELRDPACAEATDSLGRTS